MVIKLGNVQTVILAACAMTFVAFQNISNAYEYGTLNQIDSRNLETCINNQETYSLVLTTSFSQSTNFRNTFLQALNKTYQEYIKPLNHAIGTLGETTPSRTVSSLEDFSKLLTSADDLWKLNIFLLSVRASDNSNSKQYYSAIDTSVFSTTIFSMMNHAQRTKLNFARFLLDGLVFEAFDPREQKARKMSNEIFWHRDKVQFFKKIINKDFMPAEKIFRSWEPLLQEAINHARKGWNCNKFQDSFN